MITLRLLTVSISRSSTRRVTCSGRKDPSAVDGTGSNSVPQVHVIVRCVEFRRRHVGDHVVRRETVLELDQPGRHLCRRKRLSTASAHGQC